MNLTTDSTSSAQQALLVLQLDLRDVLNGLPANDCKIDGIMYAIRCVDKHLGWLNKSPETY